MEIKPRLELSSFRNEGQCFGCGEANPIGLKLVFEWDPQTKTAAGKFTPGENLQGWSGYVHGGIIACVLDEAIGWAAMFAGTNNVTAKMQVRYRRMVPIGQTYTASCTIMKQTSRLIETEAKITDRDGNIMAEGSSTQFVVGPRKDARF